MKTLASVAGSTLIAFVALSGMVRADLHLRFPQDIEPDFYQSGGPIGSLRDRTWVVIPFWRPPALVPASFNLLETFDASAIGLPLLVEGFLRLGENGPRSWQARASGDVPFWFVRATEFDDAADDGELTIAELEALPSLLTGLATFYEEQNHLFGIHPVSHYTLIASGALDDGRAFDVRFVETNLRFLQTRIAFDD